MIIALLALQTQIMSFPGGEVEQQADFVMRASGSDVVAIASENVKLPAVSVEEKDPKKRWASLAAKLGLETANLKAPGNLGFRSLPMFQDNGSARLNSKYFQEWKEAIQFLPADDRKQDRRHIRATIAVGNLSKLKLDKGLKERPGGMQGKPLSAAPRIQLSIIDQTVSYRVVVDVGKSSKIGPLEADSCIPASVPNHPSRRSVQFVERNGRATVNRPG